MTPALDRWRAWVVGRLSALWGVDLADAQVEFSSRMRRNFGRCYPQRGLVRLNSRLARRQHRGLLRETLVHELAHLAAWRLGVRGRPHGPPWQALMQVAGFVPRVTLSDPDWPDPAGRSAVRLECSDCGIVFHRRRSDYRWRCRACLELGRSGVLKSSRVSFPYSQAGPA